MAARASVPWKAKPEMDSKRPKSLWGGAGKDSAHSNLVVAAVLAKLPQLHPRGENGTNVHVTAHQELRFSNLCRKTNQTQAELDVVAHTYFLGGRGRDRVQS